MHRWYTFITAEPFANIFANNCVRMFQTRKNKVSIILIIIHVNLLLLNDVYVEGYLFYFL